MDSVNGGEKMSNELTLEGTEKFRLPCPKCSGNRVSLDSGGLTIRCICGYESSEAQHPGETIHRWNYQAQLLKPQLRDQYRKIYQRTVREIDYSMAASREKRSLRDWLIEKGVTVHYREHPDLFTVEDGWGRYLLAELQSP